MSRSITLGQYIPGESILHLLDPRIKLLSLLIILTALFWLRTAAGMVGALVFFSLLITLARVPFGYLLRGLRPIAYIVLFTLIIYFFFTEGGVVLLRLGPITIEERGVKEGLFLVARVIGLVMASMLVTLTTTPLSLTHGLGFFIRPFRFISPSVSEIPLIMSIALRFIPTLMEESQRLMRAQMARGADFERGNIFNKARNLIPLIVPLFVSAFRRADELAIAMEARGYRIGAKRTRMREEKAEARDWLVLGVSVGLLVVVVVTNI